MTGELNQDVSAAVAYQDVTLVELRALFDEIDFDLREVLEREQGVTEGVEETAAELDGVRRELEAMGVAEMPIPARFDTEAPAFGAATGPPSYTVRVVPASDDFDEIVALADARLEKLGIDLNRDPLVQVLPSSRIEESLRDYARTYGETSWDEADWAAVMAAGLAATILDIVLVRIPQDSTFVGRTQAGSPLTKWLQDGERAKAIHQRFFKKFERCNKVPFDTAMDLHGQIPGNHPNMHRLMSFGHDPLLGFVIGVADIMHGTGTYVDKYGRLHQFATGADPVDLNKALLTELRHLLSDFYTTRGVPPPLFSVMQIGQVPSPFVLRRGGPTVMWTDVARYMYRHGYDLRHFFTMGITPCVVEAIIRGHWLISNYAPDGSSNDCKGDPAKLASMLLLGHAIATSGTLVKTGVVFGMNPTALNWAQLLAMVPTTLIWIAETSARDARIRRGLDAEWDRLATVADRLVRPPGASTRDDRMTER